MKTLQNNILKAALVLLISSLSFSSMGQSELVLVTNMDNKEGTTMSPSIARATVYAKRTRWSDRSKVELALMDTSTTLGEKIAKGLFNLTGEQLNKYYLTLVFQGKITEPKFFDKQEDLIAYDKGQSQSGWCCGEFKFGRC